MKRKINKMIKPDEWNKCHYCNKKILPGEEYYLGIEEPGEPYCSEQCANDCIMYLLDNPDIG